MTLGRRRGFVWWAALSVLYAACSSEPAREREQDGGGLDASAPSGPLGRIQGRVELTDGAGLGGVTVAAQGLTTTTDELGIFVLDAAAGPEVLLTVESDYYTRARVTLEIIENSTVSSALQVVPLKRLTLEDVTTDVTVKGDDGFTITVPKDSLVTQEKQKATGKAEVRYAVLSEPSKMRAAPEMSAVDGSGNKRKLEAFSVVEVRFYKDNARLAYEGPETKLRVPLHKDHDLSQGERLEAYHFDDKAGQFRSKGEAMVDGHEVVLTANGFSTWCAARPIEHTGCVTGRVVDSAQRPAPFANVELSARQRLALARASSGADGRFCLESIAAAPHVLSVLSALEVFRGGEREVATGEQAGSCGSDACLDLGDISLEELLFEGATPAEGELPDARDMDAGQDGTPDAGQDGTPDAGPEAGSDPGTEQVGGEDAGFDGGDGSGPQDASSDAGFADAGFADAGDAQVATPVVCGTPIWLADPAACAPDLIENGGTTTVALDGESCAAFWLCAEEFNRVTLQIDYSACLRTFIYGPNHTGPVHSSGNRCNGTLLDDIALNAHGPHLVVLESSAAEGLSGNYGMTLWSVGNDPANTATLDGEPVQIAITDPGQNGSFSFTANAGDRVALTLQASTLSDYMLRSPTGLVSSLGASSTTLFSDSFVVNETGTYTVQVDPRGAGVSEFTFQVFTVPSDLSVETAVGAAQPASLQLLTPGQNGTFTFEGTAGQRIAFTVTGDTLADFTLRRGTGTQNVASLAGSSVFSDVVTLEETGPYRLVVDPRGQGTGTYTLSLWSVPADITVNATVDGPAAVLSLATPGQNGNVTFAGTVGQRIAVRVNPATLTDFALWPPLGSQYLGSWATGGALFTDVLTLPQDGTYRFSVNPRGQGIDAAMAVQLVSVPADVVVSLTPDGGDLDLTITRAGQNGEFTFDVASAQATLTLQLSTSSGLVDYQLRTPVDATIASGVISSTTITLNDVALHESGTYRLLVNPRAEALPVISASASLTDD